MSRKFLVPLSLPANPTQPLEAATKQYVDALVGKFTFVQDAVPTTTVVGATWFKTDTAEAFVWYDSAWVEYAPGGGGSLVGQVGYATKTTTQSVTTPLVWTALTGLSVTFTAQLGRMYRTSLVLQVRKLTAAGDVFVRISDAGSTVQPNGAAATLAINDYMAFNTFAIETGLSGSITRTGQIYVANNGVSAETNAQYPGVLTVEDVGAG